MTTFIKHTTLVALVGTACFAAPSQSTLYTEGKKQAHQRIDILNCTDAKQAQELSLKNSQLVAPEYLEACNALQEEPLGSPAYKKAFTEIQEFYRGVKEVMLGYTLPATVATELKEVVLAWLLNTAETFLTSADHFEATKKMDEAISQKVQASQSSFPQLPKLESFKANPEHASYKEGYSLIESSYELIDLQAQGKNIPAEKQLALNKEAAEFLQKELAKLSTNDESQYPKIAENIAQYLVGAEKALKEYPLDKTLKKHNTSKEQADKLRLDIKASTEMFTSIKEMLIEGNLSKLGIMRAHNLLKAN